MDEYYHVILKTKLDKSYGEYKTDLNKEQLVSRFIEPYEQGKPIVINGKTVSPDDIDRIKIAKSERVIESLIPAIREKDAASSIARIGGPSYQYQAIERATDITDEYITGEPGYKKLLTPLTVSKNDVFDLNKVFIVHGHDETAQSKAARFMERLGYEAIILHEQASSGRTIIEKIESYSDVGFAIVLYTPDDVGNMKNKAGNLNLRARQNVVFEHGYLIGKLGREKVVALVDGNIEFPNDISGVVYIKLDEAAAWHLHLAKEMKQQGFDIDMNKLID